MAISGFQEFLWVNNLRKKEVAEYLGVSPAFITQLASGTRPVPLEQQLKLRLNKDWNTSMLKLHCQDERKTDGNKDAVSMAGTDKPNDSGSHESRRHYSPLPLIPIDALAGFPGNDNEMVTEDDCEKYDVPELASKGAKFLIRVSGSSMYPKYSNGDLLACKKLQAASFIQWGKVYVLDTEQGALVKRLYEDKADTDCIICHSDNTERYPDFRIPKNEIRSISIVLGVIRVE